MEQLPVLSLLPAELIEKISLDDGLSIQDIINLSLTCKRLQETIRNSNAIWKIKFYQLIPLLKHELENRPESYYDELKHLYLLKKRTLSMLEEMSEKFYRHLELSENDLMDWENLLAENWNNYFYLVKDLLEIINATLHLNPINCGEILPFKTPGHLTQKYYAKKVLRQIRQIYLARMWCQYVKTPPEYCLLEEGAAIMAQWFQYDNPIDLEKISGCLDEIAGMVKSQIQLTYPNSPLLQVSDEQLKSWRTSERLDKNWKLDERCNIFRTIGQVIFHRLDFQMCDDTGISYSNFFINQALEMKRAKLPVMAIIYEAVARRLGVRCEIFINSSHFLLRFCAADDPMPVYSYINLSAKGEIYKGSCCPFQRRNAQTQSQPAASAANVLGFLANDLRQCAIAPVFDQVLLRSTLEFLKVLNPNDRRILNDIKALYLRLNFGTLGHNGADGLITDHHPPTFMEPVMRPPNDYVKFAVGMIMKHKKFYYKCVIFNWDQECVASPEWISKNQISNLKYGSKQPFYNVLVEDFSHRYVAQENLLPCEFPTSILANSSPLANNDEYGRYFSHFYRAYFLPNEVTEKLFPQDGEIRKKFHDDLTRASRRRPK